MALVQAAPGTVLITGTTSGVGVYATKSLVERGWRVITANRSSLRAETAALSVGLPFDSPRQLKHFQIDLGIAGGSVTGVSGTGNIIRFVFEHIGEVGQRQILISSESNVRDVYNNSVVEHIFPGVVSIW